MSDLNPNCDGSHCLKATSDVRVYPLGGGANLILCFDCAAHENKYRYNRGRELNDFAAFPQVNWFACKPYPEETVDEDRKNWAWDTERQAWIHVP